MQRWQLIVGLALLLSACNLTASPPSSPTPEAIIQNPTRAAPETTAAVTAEITPEITPSVTAIVTVQPSPTATISASPTDAIVPVPIVPTSTGRILITIPADTPAPTLTSQPDNVSVPTVAPVIPTTAPSLAQVKSDARGLRLRTQPSTDSGVLAYLSENTPLTILGRSGDNVWLNVQVTQSGESGWVMTQYVDLASTIAVIPVTFTTPEPTATATDYPGNAIVIAEGEGLRVRALPSTNAIIINVLPEQQGVTITGRNPDNTWLKVTAPGFGEGWVYAAYIQTAINIAGLTIPDDAYEPTPAAFTPPSFAPTENRITGITSTSVQIFRRGQALGNRPDVFSKVGDSITVATFYLYPFGWGEYNLRDFAYYQGALGYFSRTIARDSNSFANSSLAADNGWTTRTLLDANAANAAVCLPGETPIACEYRLVRPSIALILVGTNDLSALSSTEYRQNLTRIVDFSIAKGVIPVLSTLPPREDYAAPVTDYNNIIRNLARSRDIPLWDYHGAMTMLPGKGLIDDRVHPSIPGQSFALSADLTRENLQYGFPLRNLMTLQVLDALWRQVIAGNVGAVSNAGAASPPQNSVTVISTAVPVAPTVAPVVDPVGSVITADSGCPGAPPPRLVIGQQARVTPGAGNNLREQPSPYAAQVGILPGEAVFNVLDGPRCTEGYYFWQVDYGGLTGWTAEGQGADYWLEPL